MAKLHQYICANLRNAKHKYIHIQQHPKLHKTIQPTVINEQINKCRHEVCGSSSIGHALFSFALLKHLAVSVKDSIEEVVAKFTSGAMNQETLNRFKFEAVEKCNDLPMISLLPDRRDIQAPFGACLLTFTASSIQAEVNFRFAVAWKEAAVIAQKLKPLWCEALLGADPTKSYTGIVDQELCNNAGVVRGQAEELFKQVGNTADAVLQMVRSRSSRLLLSDPDFTVEIAMLETLCGEYSQTLLADKMLELFPDENANTDVEDTFQQINVSIHEASWKSYACIRVSNVFSNSSPYTKVAFSGFLLVLYRICFCTARLLILSLAAWIFGLRLSCPGIRKTMSVRIAYGQPGSQGT